jgi:hypothetical protein
MDRYAPLAEQPFDRRSLMGTTFVEIADPLISVGKIFDKTHP